MESMEDWEYIMEVLGIMVHIIMGFVIIIIEIIKNI
jgi:hypothetical protein